MLVTDLQYSMEPLLLRKIDLMIQRCEQKNPEKDSLLIIEGAEGDGKTNMSVAVGYYIAQKTGRSFSVENLFFSAEKLIEFAKSTQRQIIIYDEPALSLLSNEWWNEEQRNLTKLLMMCRKNRHFIIINMTKFNKFNEYMVVDRPVGMIHVYSQKEIKIGKFVYIPKKNLEYLYNTYRAKHIRTYKKYQTFHGTFPNIMPKIIDMELYNKNKDEAILSIGEKKETKKASKEREELEMLQAKLAKMPDEIKTKEDVLNWIGISDKNLRKWGDLKVNNLHRLPLIPVIKPNIIISVDKSEKINTEQMPKLPLTQREEQAMRILSNYSGPDAARLLGISYRNVKALKSEAKAKGWCIADFMGQPIYITNIPAGQPQQPQQPQQQNPIPAVT